ncbi:MAG: hypothetical protein ABL958_04675 [Bdellovibrionia bacterium]
MGQKTMLFRSVDPGISLTFGKLALKKGLFCFAKGDHFWSSFRIKILGATLPGTIMDLESDHLYGLAGPRLSLHNGSLRVENKFGAKEIYSQQNPIPFPTSQWVDIKIHLVLDDTGAGIIEAWQNNTKVISAQGKNLPLSDTILNRYEIGVTVAEDAVDLEIDDVRVSNEPL